MLCYSKLLLLVTSLLSLYMGKCPYMGECKWAVLLQSLVVREEAASPLSFTLEANRLKHNVPRVKNVHHYWHISVWRKVYRAPQQAICYAAGLACRQVALVTAEQQAT